MESRRRALTHLVNAPCPPRASTRRAGAVLTVGAESEMSPVMPLGRVINALRHPIVIRRYLSNRRRLLRLRYRQRGNRGIFSVNFRRGGGFFAHMTWCMYVMSYCHDRHLIPHVTSDSPLYTDRERGADFLAYFFDRPERDLIDARVIERANVERVQELGLPTYCIAQMTLERAAMLVRRYMPIRQEIADEVDRFAERHFAPGSVLGVHFRGTDKRTEAPPVSRAECSAAIRRYLSEHPGLDRIFVASDEASFIGFIEGEFPSIPVCSCDDRRSDGDVAVHRLGFAGGNYEKGRQALVNCLLLSRCDLLIRTASSLSGWASVFNPRLPVVMLNQPHPQCLWFPDRCVVPRATLVEAMSNER
jgi:hypothetical protein